MKSFECFFLEPVIIRELFVRDHGGSESLNKALSLGERGMGI